MTIMITQPQFMAAAREIELRRKNGAPDPEAEAVLMYAAQLERQVFELSRTLADANQFLRELQQGEPINLDTLRKQLNADWQALHSEHTPGETPCQ